jgi:hypothetical protein
MYYIWGPDIEAERISNFVFVFGKLFEFFDESPLKATAGIRIILFGTFQNQWCNSMDIRVSSSRHERF